MHAAHVHCAPTAHDEPQFGQVGQSNNGSHKGGAVVELLVRATAGFFVIVVVFFVVVLLLLLLLFFVDAMSTGQKKPASIDANGRATLVAG